MPTSCGLSLFTDLIAVLENQCATVRPEARTWKIGNCVASGASVQVVDIYCTNKRRTDAVGERLLKSRERDVLRWEKLSRAVGLDVSRERGATSQSFGLSETRWTYFTAYRPLKIKASLVQNEKCRISSVNVSRVYVGFHLSCLLKNFISPNVVLFRAVAFRADMRFNTHGPLNGQGQLCVDCVRGRGVLITLTMESKVSFIVHRHAPKVMKMKNVLLVRGNWTRVSR